MPWNGVHWTNAKPRQWYTPRDVARVLQVHIRTVHIWCKAGKLRYTLTPGGRYRFTASDVMLWTRTRSRR